MLFLALTVSLIFCSAESDSHEWRQTMKEKIQSRSFDLGGVDLNIFLDSLENQTGLPGMDLHWLECS